MKIGIAGLGLIGGSLAKAFKKYSDATVYGYDIDSSITDIAQIYGATDHELTSDNITECDCVLISLYPRAAVEFLKDNAPHIKPDTLVIDCCGTKRMVCKVGFELAKKHGFVFAGGHPMAGTHKSGFANSNEDLFKGACMVLVPPVFDDIILLERVKTVLKPAGFGQISVTTAEKHDKLIAFTSQMAHVVSNAYIKSPVANEHKGVSAGSYKDLTRVAWLNPDMWADLFIENKDNLLNELDFFINSLKEYRSAIAAEDDKKLRELLEEGRKRKEEVDGK